MLLYSTPFNEDLELFYLLRAKTAVFQPTDNLNCPQPAAKKQKTN